MPSENSSAVKFEIGHVLFIDIVGYSKLLINEQSNQIQTLKEIVRGTEQVRPQLFVTPFILTYKNDPRFAAFCQKLKLPAPTTVFPTP